MRRLINHNIKFQAFANAVLTGQTADGAPMFSVDRPLPEEGVEAAIKSNIDAMLATPKSIDLSAMVTTPFGNMPAGHFEWYPWRT